MSAPLAPDVTTTSGDAPESGAAHRGWREGRRAGLIATAAGALWSMAVDLLMGHPFETWTFLGAGFLALFHLTAPAAVDAIVFLVLTSLFFMLIGRIGVMVAHRSAVQPYLILIANFTLTLITLALVAYATAFSTSRLGHDAWPQILGSPLIAFWTLGFRLYRTHPSLRAALRHVSDS